MDKYNFDHPLIFEAATDEEIKVLLEKLTARHDRTISGYPIIEGFIYDIPVVIGRNKVGMVDAAIFTQILVMNYAACCILCAGTAGSHRDDLHVGDIVIGRDIRNMSAKSMSDEECKELEDCTNGEWIILEAMHSDPEFVNIAMGTTYEHGQLIKGVIGTGDFWSHGRDDIMKTRERYKTDCEDMETFAVAQVANQNEIPFLAIRIISNNELSGETFDPQVEYYCQDYVLDVLKKAAEIYYR